MSWLQGFGVRILLAGILLFAIPAIKILKKIIVAYGLKTRLYFKRRNPVLIL